MAQLVRMGPVLAASMALLCWPLATAAAGADQNPHTEMPNTDAYAYDDFLPYDSEQAGAGMHAATYVMADPETLELVEGITAEDFEAGLELDAHVGPFRRLLHGCHGRTSQFLCERRLFKCPRCKIPPSANTVGHCKDKKRLFTCHSGRSTETNRLSSRFLATGDDSLVDINQCPSVHAGSWPGHYDLPSDADYYDGDYTTVNVSDTDVSAAFELGELGELTVPLEFAEVSTPDEFQMALRAGVNHILLTAHLDMVDSTPVRDLRNKEALNNAVGRVDESTISIAGQCEGPVPDSFQLREALPPGACAVQVKEDFLDAPLGTTCLLIDSLYVLVAPRGLATSSSVLILHIDGFMWITNCVFQGSGAQSRAIDTNTENKGTPALFISNTTFSGFTRSQAPGIKANEGARLWVDTCAFRNITLTQPNQDFLELIQATAIAAFSQVELVIANITVEDNTVIGEPAGDQAIAIQPNGTRVLAVPRGTVWQWPDGPFVQTDEDTATAQAIIEFAREVLADIQDIQKEIVQRGLRRQERLERDG